MDKQLKKNTAKKIKLNDIKMFLFSKRYNLAGICVHSRRGEEIEVDPNYTLRLFKSDEASLSLILKQGDGYKMVEFAVINPYEFRMWNMDRTINEDYTYEWQNFWMKEDTSYRTRLIAYMEKTIRKYKKIYAALKNWAQTNPQPAANIEKEEIETLESRLTELKNI